MSDIKGTFSNRFFSSRSSRASSLGGRYSSNVFRMINRDYSRGPFSRSLTHKNLGNIFSSILRDDDPVVEPKKDAHRNTDLADNAKPGKGKRQSKLQKKSILGKNVAASRKKLDQIKKKLAGFSPINSREKDLVFVKDLHSSGKGLKMSKANF